MTCNGIRNPAVEKRIHRSVERAERLRGGGEYRRAERLYRKTLAAGERAFGRDAVEVAVLLNNLGVVCKYLGRFREAGRHYRRALGILERRRVTNPADLTSLYHTLGGLEHARGRFARGEPFARRSPPPQHGRMPGEPRRAVPGHDVVPGLSG
jgi:hypothetical protein